jgi:hypothetical protein
MSATANAELYRMALQNAAVMRARAEETRRRAQQTIEAVVPKARNAGIAVSELAEILGVTRQGVYFLLRRPGSSSGV